VRIDLHVHSTASDGSRTPAQIVQAARAGRLDVLALADHDTVAGVEEAIHAAGRHLKVIPAVEVSSTHAGAEVHILGYYVDPAAPALVGHSGLAAARRADRMRGMIQRLADLGIHVTMEEVLTAAGPSAASLGRPHLARVLVTRRYAQSFADAFDRYLADGGPAFLPTALLTPREAIDLIHEAGGVAVWAHPPLDTFERELPLFLSWGIDGIECFRPKSRPSESQLLEETAKLNDLLVTGGSDWHGTWHGPLGSFALSRSDVEAFLAVGGL
jgi:3',5'-nucleoside bisphosphate phosphatase